MYKNTTAVAINIGTLYMISFSKGMHNIAFNFHSTTCYVSKL